MQQLLRTKLYPPETPDDFIERERLLAKLAQGSDRKLTLVCAPAGYGKTSLVVSWLRKLTEAGKAAGLPVRAAWYTIDETDNDLFHFFGYFVAAVRDADSSLLADWVDLERRPTPPTPEEIAGELLLSSLNLHGRLVVVLDDYQFITDQAIHRTIGYLLRYLSTNLHLVIITRFDQPVGLPQLRARNQINELRAHDLALSLEETSAFFRSVLDFRLDPEVVDAVWKRAEGWAVGLRLAAISIQTENGLERFEENFLKNVNRHVAGYLLDEVLSRQTPDTHHFLLCTSILSRFNADLCAAVAGEPAQESRSTLDLLIARNLFVIPLDEHGEWYRYHSQFQSMLRNRLRSQLPEAQMRAMHSRAAGRLAAEGLVDEALPHFLAAEEPDAAADLVERHIPAMLNEERFRGLERWLSLLPEELVERRPALLLVRAWVYYMNLVYDPLKALVDRAEALLLSGEAGALEPDAVRGQIYALRASPALTHDRYEARVMEEAWTALRLLPQSYGWVRAMGMNFLAQMTTVSGQFEAAQDMLETELAAAPALSSTDAGRLYFSLGAIHYYSGNIDGLYRAMTILLDVATRNNIPLQILWAEYALGTIHLERNEPDAAVVRLEKVFARPQLAQFVTLLVSADLLLPLYAARDRFEDGRNVLAILRRHLKAMPDTHSLKEFEALEAYWALLSGNVAVAALWAQTVGDDPTIFYLSFRGRIQAQILMALGRPADLQRATGILENLLKQYETAHRIRGIIQTNVLLAQVYRMRHMTRPALAALGKALELGYPRGFRRTFTEGGPDMTAMLRELAREPKYAEPVGMLLTDMTLLVEPARKISAHEAIGSSAVQESLSYRELEILGLMAQGLSNKEIAARLYISPLTVRNHASHIFEKLNVGSRREAARLARVLGLLS